MMYLVIHRLTLLTLYSFLYWSLSNSAVSVSQTRDPRGGGGNTAHSLLHTTLALGVFFVYVAPDSHSFGFPIVSPLHCDRLSPTIWTIPMFATHLVHVRMGSHPIG